MFRTGNLGPCAREGRAADSCWDLGCTGAEYLGQPVKAKAERRNGTGLCGPEEHFFGRPPLTLKLRQLVMICVWALRDQKESLEDSDTGVRSGRGY